MNEFDDKLRAALSAGESDRPAAFDEPAFLEQVIDTFRGRSRWLVAMTMGATLGWTIFGVVSAFQFFAAQELRGMLAWGGGVLISVICIGMLKVWYWMELNKNAVTREVKRLELQIARLARQ